MDERELREIIRQYKLFDDILMQCCFNDKATIQEVIRIILGRPFVVKDVKVQNKITPNAYHGAIFDVLAIDENGKLCDIEIQREDTGNLVKRAEFYSSTLVTMALNKGENYDKLRETFVIFITETDVFNRKLPLYLIDRRFEDTKEIFNGGSHIVFVNGEYSGDDEIGHFVSDMKECDPNKMYNKILSDRVRIFKETDEEVSNMENLTKKVYDMGYNEATKHIESMRKKVYDMGYSEATKQMEGMRKKVYEMGVSEGVTRGVSQGISQGISQQKEQDDKVIAQLGTELARLRYALDTAGIKY